jgi:hypothetical protein
VHILDEVLVVRYRIVILQFVNYLSKVSIVKSMRASEASKTIPRPQREG